jgi:glycosyltransferase involved in cell wall biosynthesis
MKISVFFDRYSPEHEFKDPGQIPLGLKEIGLANCLLTLKKPNLVNHNPSITILQEEEKVFNLEDYWLKNDSDVIIAYTWLSGAYNKILSRMKKSGKKVLIKADSDGLIGYPLPNRNLRVPIFEGGTIPLSLALRISWHRPFKFLFSKRTKRIIKEIELSDGVIIESPEALSNLNYFLCAWGRTDLISKNHFIPNPTAQEFINSEIKQKEDIAVAFGRWDDRKQKNTKTMAETVVDFLKERPNFRFLIFGSGTELVRSLVTKAPTKVRSRITVLGFVEREKIKVLLANAKIFFVPSRWESFSIASGEALCMGCSVVGTPLECLRYLSMQGFSGTTATSFKREDLLAALLQDTIKWENGLYQPEKTAAFWKANLNRAKIATEIENLALKISEASDKP